MDVEPRITVGVFRPDGPLGNEVANTIESMRKLLGDNDVLAYLVMMTARLLELRRVLKPTGSLYLYCDPTASISSSQYESRGVVGFG